ncbi:Uncharacterized protein FWK35_00035414, partial [Aphis craccivora]
ISSPNNTQAEKSIQNLIFSNNCQSDSVQIVNNLLDSENLREICSPVIEESFLSFNAASQCDETRLNLKKWAVDYNISHHALNGLYYHFGVENGIKLNINRCLESDNIELVIGIDGLPLFK